MVGGLWNSLFYTLKGVLFPSVYKSECPFPNRKITSCNLSSSLPKGW